MGLLFAQNTLVGAWTTSQKPLAIVLVLLSQIVSLVTAPVILSIEYITSMVDFSYFCTAVILDEVNAA